MGGFVVCWSERSFASLSRHGASGGDVHRAPSDGVRRHAFPGPGGPGWGRRCAENGRKFSGASEWSKTHVPFLAQIFYQHVPDLRLREVFKNDFPRDGRAMWQHLVGQCRIQVDDLRLIQHDADFDTASLACGGSWRGSHHGPPSSGLKKCSSGRALRSPQPSRKRGRCQQSGAEPFESPRMFKQARPLLARTAQRPPIQQPQ